MFVDKLKQGTSLYLAIMIITILLAIALGLSTIFISQSRTIKEIGNSVIAFYAADAGIEKVLIQRADPLSLNGYSETMANGAVYILSVLSSEEGSCTADNFCIKSIGIYKETRRAIEIIY